MGKPYDDLRAQEIRNLRNNANKDNQESTSKRKGVIVIRTDLDEDSDKFRSLCVGLALLFHEGEISVKVKSPFRKEM